MLRFPSKRLFDIAVSCFLLADISSNAGHCATGPSDLTRSNFLQATSRGPGGECFSLLRVRSTVYARQDPGPALTHRADPRVTTMGQFLRRFKLDERPSFSMLCVEMCPSLARPDVPEHVSRSPTPSSRYFFLRPGVAGAATVHFRNEDAVLSRVPQSELLSSYTGTLLPKKISGRSRLRATGNVLD